MSIHEEKQIGKYILINQIGIGGFAKVYLGFHIPTSQKVAIKILNKLQLKQNPETSFHLQNEISILKQVSHPNIVRLFEIIETPLKIYLITELCSNGELFDYISNKDKLNESTAKSFYIQILNAIEYLHSQCIVHRDIKPENMLLDEHYNIKLIDFGISEKYIKGEQLAKPCGTIVYAPPEMHKRKMYVPLLSDIWSSGIVLYAMLCGYLPFNSEHSEDTTISNIVNEQVEFPTYVSELAKDLIRRILEKEPLQRYGIDDIRNHPWIKDSDELVKSKYKYKSALINMNMINNDILDECCQVYSGNRDKIVNSVTNGMFNEHYGLYSIVLYKKQKEMKGDDVCNNNILSTTTATDEGITFTPPYSNVVLKIKENIIHSPERINYNINDDFLLENNLLFFTEDKINNCKVFPTPTKRKYEHHSNNNNNNNNKHISSSINRSAELCNYIATSTSDINNKNKRHSLFTSSTKNKQSSRSLESKRKYKINLRKMTLFKEKQPKHNFPHQLSTSSSIQDKQQQQQQYKKHQNIISTLPLTAQTKKSKHALLAHRCVSASKHNQNTHFNISTYLNTNSIPSLNTSSIKHSNHLHQCCSTKPNSNSTVSKHNKTIKIIKNIQNERNTVNKHHRRLRTFSIDIKPLLPQQNKTIFNKQIIDLNCIVFLSQSELLGKLLCMFKDYKISAFKKSKYKYHCNKKGIFFEIEIFKLDETLPNISYFTINSKLGSITTSSVDLNGFINEICK